MRRSALIVAAISAALLLSGCGSGTAPLATSEVATTAAGQSAPAAADVPTAAKTVDSTTTPGERLGAPPGALWYSNSEGQLQPIKGLPNVVQVAGGNNDWWILGQDGSLWFTTTDGETTTELTKVNLPFKAVKVAPGFDAGYILGDDGVVYRFHFNVTGLGPTSTTGPEQNAAGQLTVGGPEKVNFGQAVVDIAGLPGQGQDYSHFYAVLADGTLWAWGSSEYGLLGDNRPVSTTNRVEHDPLPVQNVSGAVSVWVSGASAGAVLADGSAVLWGSLAGYGGVSEKIGKTSTAVHLVGSPPLKGLAGLIGLAKDGTVWSWLKSSPVQMSGITTLSAPTEVMGPKGVAVLSLPVLTDGSGALWKLDIQDDGAIVVGSGGSVSSSYRDFPKELDGRALLWNMGSALVFQA